MPVTAETKVIPDRARVKVRPLFTDTIPGDLAFWRLDCETVWDSRATACPACGSKAAMHLKWTLDREGVRVKR